MSKKRASSPSEIAPTDPWEPGYRHLEKAHSRWPDLIKQFGPCPLLPKPPERRFDLLVSAIIGQQISTKAADAIEARLRQLSSDPFIPQQFLQLSEDHFRSAGLSAVKTSYVRNLTEAVVSGRLDLESIHQFDDQTIAKKLTELKGIGTWTSDIFLIFSLCRPDILALGDLGIRAGLREFYNLPEIPKPSECPSLTEAWRPHRTVAMWYLWKLKDASFLKN